MSCPRLPPEVSEYVIDLLHSQPETLGGCCLVSKSWVPRARKHLFRHVRLRSFDDLKAWQKNFPDPANSPAYYTRSLFIGCAQVIPAAVEEEGGWIQAFSNVTCLSVSSTRHFRFWFLPQLLTFPRFPCVVPDIISASSLFKLVCSLPLLEDLDVLSRGVSANDDDSTIFQPSASPPLTGTLTLSLIRGMEPVTRRLLELPSGVRFRKLECTLYLEEDFPCAMAMVGECSDTLECVEIDCGDLCKFHPFGFPHSHRLTFTSALVDLDAGSIDFSGATRLKELVFHLEEIEDVWTTMALKTLTSKHGDLREILLHILVESSPKDEPVNVRETIGEEIFKQWMDLDHILVQLWESSALQTKVIYFTDQEEKETHEYIGGLLQEVMKRGIVKMVDERDLF